MEKFNKKKCKLVSKIETCKKCKKKDQKIIGSQWKDDKNKYVDSRGKRWFGTICYECMNKSRLKGRSKSHPTHKKGLDSELVAKKYFEKLGYPF